MSWVATAVLAAGTLYQKHESKKAQEQAREDQLEADKQARKAEAFADTEGQGKGQLGQISLEVDEDLEDADESLNISI